MGTWASLTPGGTTFTTALGTYGPMHVGAYVQNVSSTGATLDIDRVTLTSVPEPSGLALLGCPVFSVHRFAAVAEAVSRASP